MFWRLQREIGKLQGKLESADKLIESLTEENMQLEEARESAAREVEVARVNLQRVQRDNDRLHAKLIDSNQEHDRIGEWVGEVLVSDSTIFALERLHRNLVDIRTARKVPGEEYPWNK